MKGLRIWLLLGAVLLEVGCGLPDSFYLQPPSAGLVASGLSNTPFHINGTSRANDINVTFSGYELYYKCYDSQNSSALSADQNYGSSSYSYSDLLQNGFHRVCRGPGQGGALAVDTSPGSGNAPLIDIDKIDSAHIGSNFTIDIIPNSLSPPAFGFVISYGGVAVPVTYFAYTPPSGTAPTAGWEIRRFIQADPNLASASGYSSICKPFTQSGYFTGLGLSSTNWYSTDADITSAVYTSGLTNGGIWVMVYAFSYGTGVDGTARYSSPVYLGYTLIPIA